MKMYLAGPMAGYENFNRHAFDVMAVSLRREGHAIVNPHELDDEMGIVHGTDEDNFTVTPKARAAYMRRDLPLLLGCHAIVLLDGWNRSRGACVEAVTAMSSGLDVYCQNGADSAVKVALASVWEASVTGVREHLASLSQESSTLLDILG